jgi:putative tricarboxylic transport membrane protein
MKRDVIVAVVCLAASVVLYATLGHIEEARAAIFPKVIIIAIGVLSALLLLQTLIVQAPVESAAKEKYPWARFVLLFSMIVVYLAVMETLGFYVSAFLFFVVVCIILGRADLTIRRSAVWVAGALGMTGVLFLLFRVLLEVQTPRGVLF